MDAKRLDHACAKVGACPAIRTPLLTGQLRPVIAGTDTANKVVTLYREHQRAKADCEQRGYDTSAFEVEEPGFEAADDIQQPDDAQMQENLVKQGKFTAGAMFYTNDSMPRIRHAAAEYSKILKPQGDLRIREVHEYSRFLTWAGR